MDLSTLVQQLELVANGSWM